MLSSQRATLARRMPVLPDGRAQIEPVSDLRPQLAVIRNRFLENLAERCLEIETIVQQIEAGGVRLELVQEIAARAHKIAGVAPTLGFTRLGALSTEVEAQLASLPFKDMWPNARDLLEIYLTEIEHVLDAYSPV